MLRFSTDHYFHIGSAHYQSGKPCQDYALSGVYSPVACAVVSDGCSTGRHTDVGARVLTLSTLQAIRDHAKASGGALNTAVVSITSRQQQILSTTRIILGLERNDMLATCGYVYLTQFGGFVHVQGDGVIALKYRNKQKIKMFRYEWDDNTPYYPSYGDGDLEKFAAAHGGDWDAVRLRRTVAVKYADDNYSEEDEDREGFTLREGLEGVALNIPPELLEDLEFVGVFTDGITQIGEPNGSDALDWRVAVQEFMAFKTAAGEFAKRRMIRGIRTLAEVGKGPVDDISYAVVRIEPAAEEGGSLGQHPSST